MRMLRFSATCCALVAAVQGALYAEAPVLVRDAAVSLVQTFRGAVAAQVTPITPASDVTLVVLTQTMQPEDSVRIRRMLAKLSASFLSRHRLQLAYVSGTGDAVSSEIKTAMQLQVTLKSIPLPQPGTNTGAGLFAVLERIARTLPGDWAQAVIIGRFPQAGSDERWQTAWMGEVLRSRRIRTSFWSLGGAAPAWCWNLSASTLGAVAADDFPNLLAKLDEDTSTSVYEAAWQTDLPQGAWAYTAEVKNRAGERVLRMESMASAAGFVLPLEIYLRAREAMAAAPARELNSAQAVLSLNPSDADALRRLATGYAEQKNPQQSMTYWKRLTEVLPQHGVVWAELASQSYTSGAYEDAEQALKRANELGSKSAGTLELDARLRFRRKDFRGAIPVLDEALAGSRGRQDLWLLRADCGRELNEWAVEAESIERAIALGPLPLDRQTALIAGYLSHSSPDRALPYLRAATDHLPRNAALHAQYAMFWEQEKDGDATAEKLWRAAVAADSGYEPAYFGLAHFYLERQRSADAVKVADTGLQNAAESSRLVLVKSDALEEMGDLYSARRFVKGRISKTKDIEMLKRWARLEDLYGSAGADAYTVLLNAMIQGEFPQSEIVEVCRRGLQVSLRSERMDAARLFAQKLQGWGDPAGLDLIGAFRQANVESAEVPGGADGLSFLVFGRGNAKPDRFLLDYSRALTERAMGPNKASFLEMGLLLRNYFQQVAALVALGSRRGERVEITLSLNDKTGRQRTEKVFKILGLKLNRGKAGLKIESAEGKSQAKRQDVVAALAVDEEGIQEALAAGKAYILEIPMDRVPAFPAEGFWRAGFFEHQQYPGGLAEAFVTDPRLPRLYLALNSMDRGAARVLLQAMPLRTLEERYSTELSQFSAALAESGNNAEVPGGQAAYGIWQSLTGANPANPGTFFQALLSRDQGKLIAFFYTLSQLDMTHQRFFTRSSERAKRFYDLFRESSEAQRGIEHGIVTSAFLEFLREVPLNEDASIDFPGGPEIWMVAKGAHSSTSAMAKLSKKARRVAAPEDEDAILIRLAGTAYKAESQEQSELSNFIAVTRIEAQRTSALSAESALLLAQNYSAFGALYPYFAALGGLEARDFQNLFSIAGKIEGLDAVTANIRLGQLHSFLALLCVLAQSGTVEEQGIEQLYRKALDRYSRAQGSPEWTSASLANIDDLAHAAGAGRVSSRQAALEILLIGDGEPATQRHTAFQQVLELQKVPSLDALLAIRDRLAQAPRDARAVDAIEKQLDAFVVMTPPKTWKNEGLERKCLEHYQTTAARKTIAKIREALAKKKRNESDIARLSSELLGELEPWTELAMAGQVYARYLDPSDLIVSEDGLLLRKHAFVELSIISRKRSFLGPAAFTPSSEGEGSFFSGGFAEFSLASGQARAIGNHVGSPISTAVAGSLFGSIRGTDWRLITQSTVQRFAARVRLAREWMVESAASREMLSELEDRSLGLLSLTRRAKLIDGIQTRNWPAVWDAVSISDLYFLGDSLIDRSPMKFWRGPTLEAMKRAAGAPGSVDALGQVAPDLSGCAVTRLHRYEPYEEYERYLLPNRLAERVAELKLYLAWQADSLAWPAEAVANVASPAADAVIKKLRAGDLRDWMAVLDAYRSLDSDALEFLLSKK